MRRRDSMRTLRCASSLLSIAAALLIVNDSAGASCRGLQGTFLQLTGAQAARPTEDWRKLIGELRTIGVGDLFLQWTVADRKAFFPTATFDTAANTPLPEI